MTRGIASCSNCMPSAHERPVTMMPAWVHRIGRMRWVHGLVVSGSTPARGGAYRATGGAGAYAVAAGASITGPPPISRCGNAECFGVEREVPQLETLDGPAPLRRGEVTGQQF